MIQKKLLATISLSLILCTGLFAQELLTLEGVLDVAYQNSPDIQQSELSLIRSQESLKAQRAGLKSQFSLDVTPLTYSNSRKYDRFNKEWYTDNVLESGGRFSIEQPILKTNSTVSLTNDFQWQRDFSNDEQPNSYYNNLSLNLSQPIFTYNQQKVELAEVELDLENSILSYALQKLQIEQLVSQYFYNVHQNQQSLLVAQEELDNQKESYNIIKNKVDAGLSAEEELWQSDLDLANAQSALYNAEVSLQNAEDQLKQTIGMPLDKEITIITNIQSQTIDVDIADAIYYAKEQRMEIRQAQIDITNEEFNLIRTKTTNEFAGEVSISLGLTGLAENFSEIYQGTNIQDDEVIAVSLSIPIFDWGERKARIKASEATLQSTKYDLDNEMIDIELNIRQVYRNLKNYMIQIGIAEKTLENAEKTYDLNLLKYTNGDLTSLDLSRYQEQLSDAKNALVNAKIDYNLELLNLKIQTLWDFEKQQSIVPKNIDGIILKRAAQR